MCSALSWLLFFTACIQIYTIFMPLLEQPMTTLMMVLNELVVTPVIGIWHVDEKKHNFLIVWNMLMICKNISAMIHAWMPYSSCLFDQLKYAMKPDVPVLIIRAQSDWLPLALTTRLNLCFCWIFIFDIIYLRVGQH